MLLNDDQVNLLGEGHRIASSNPEGGRLGIASQSVAMRDLNIPHERMNVLGGACAMGHPIGASGARIVVTLLNALRSTGGRRGVAAVCIGGGEAATIGIVLI